MKLVTICFLGVLGLLMVLLPLEAEETAAAEEDEEWPFEIILFSCKSHMDPSFGRTKCSLKKPKGEKLKRLSIYIETVQEIFCELQVTMNAKIKSNGNWVNNYNSEPKNYEAYYTQNEELLEHLFGFGNFSKCPMPAGRYELNNVLIDPTKFPKKMECGEYIMELKFEMPGTTALALEVGAEVQKK